MAISRCNKCGTTTEHDKSLIETRQNCNKCGSPTLIYDTIFFVNKLSSLFFTQQKELKTLREAASVKAEKPVNVSEDLNTDLDIHNSDFYSSENQLAPVITWFKAKNISASANPSAVDTTGFFDEASLVIGTNYALFGEVCERVRYAQKKQFNSAIIQLEKKSKDDIKLLEQLIKQLYDHSLFARQITNKKEANIRVVLQNAPSVRKFFDGDWLEWYVLMTGLRVFRESATSFHCARNILLSLQNDERRELDVFFLINQNQPIYIECKTGEFRHDIEKYVALRKRLGIEKKYFILCVAGLELEQARGLSAMYDMTFLNTETIAEHLLTII